MRVYRAPFAVRRTVQRMLDNSRTTVILGSRIRNIINYKRVMKYTEHQLKLQRGAGARYRKKWPERLAALRRKATFGITMEQYDEKLTAQNGLCAICRKQETAQRKGVVKRLAVDHCHHTGMIRGLLCQKCNVAIGSFNDDPEMLKKAIAYIEVYSTASLPSNTG
jgi:hypothetical protein